MSLLSLRRPSQKRVEQALLSQDGAPLTYELVGGTRGMLPAGWNTDDAQVVVGRGQAAFQRAVHALRQWRQFDLDWVWPVDTDVAIEPGAHFAFLAHTLGVWSINVCRVVYVIDDADADAARFGFAYGTIGAHSVRGEERFAVAWDRASDEVTFGIRKFSRPAGPLLTVLGPVTLWVQKRFTTAALQRLAQEVAP